MVAAARMVEQGMGGAPCPDKPRRTLGAVGGRSATGPFHSRPIAALQFFGRYWGHSGHRDALEPEGTVVNEP